VKIVPPGSLKNPCNIEFTGVFLFGVQDLGRAKMKKAPGLERIRGQGNN
jgi:hypothetical protein